MPKKNKRKFKRAQSKYALKCQPYPLKEGKEGTYVICNDISADGILFTSLVVFKTKQKLKLDLKLPGWDKFWEKLYKKKHLQTDTYSMVAKVVRIVDIGDNVYQIAAHFISKNNAKQKALLKYIKENEKPSKNTKKSRKKTSGKKDKN